MTGPSREPDPGPTLAGLPEPVEPDLSTLTVQPATHAAAPADAPPVAPESVDVYLVRAELGRGGMGWVFDALDTTLQRRVALKVMLPHLALCPVSRERFLREARAQAAVDHPHVAAIHRGDEDGGAGAPYIVMPLLEGMTLSKYRRRAGRLPAAEVARIGRQIALGLAAAHACGLIHRDIKPTNVFLVGPGREVKILDFGLVHALKLADEAQYPPRTPAGAAPATDPADQATLTRVGTVLGTPGYMAPEQATGAAADARADLFSVGVVLYELATGRSPFTRPTVPAMLDALRDYDPPPVRTLRPDLPAALAAAIDGLMAKDPAARAPGTAAELAERLRTACDVAPPAPRPRRRVALGACVVLSGLLLAALALLRPAAKPPATALAAAELFARHVAGTEFAHEFRDRSRNGFLNNERLNIHRYAGRVAAVPDVAAHDDGTATVHLFYDGHYSRESTEFGLVTAREGKTAGGKASVLFKIVARKPHIVRIDLSESVGVDDATHKSHVTARAGLRARSHAVLALSVAPHFDAE